GGVYCGTGSTITFEGCTFSDSTVTGGMSGLGGAHYWGSRRPQYVYVIPSYGSGVYSDAGSKPTFINCNVIGNRAGDVYEPGDPNDPNEPNEPAYRLSPYISYGGGICYISADMVTITDCNFMDNYATVGGGLYWDDTDSTITDSTFAENSAIKGGGLYCIDSAVATITGCEMRGNRALEGGAIHCASTPALFADCQIADNYADVSGAGAYLTGGALEPMRLRNCLVAGNAAGIDGGGVSCNIYGNVIISNTTITDNRLAGLPSYGGGLGASYNSNVEVIDSIIWANRSSDGAQIAIIGGDPNLPLPSAVNIAHSDVGPPYDPNVLPVFSSGDFSSGGSGQGSAYSVLVDGQTVYDQFDAGREKVEVIVSLIGPAEMKAATDWKSLESVNLLRAEIADRQLPVLSSLAPAEFTLRHRFENQAGFSGEVTLEGLSKLLDDPSVVHIEPVRTLYPSLAQGIPLMNATGARQSHNGEGIAIAICDTGVDYNHPMLGGGGFPNIKVIGGYDFGDDDADPIPGPNIVGPNIPDTAHGTACAGIAAGDLGIVGDYIGGVAHNAKIYALKITSDNDPGQGATTADMVAAWDWCVTHKNDEPAYPIMVTSTSFGAERFFNSDDADNDSPAMKAAADNALAAGITVLAASGNESYTDSLAWPAAISSVISVGAVHDATYYFQSLICQEQAYPDSVTCYSNTAEFLDILAPSNNAYTTDIVGSGGYNIALNGDYVDGSATSLIGYFGGTSAACPYAAGAVACLQSAALDKLGTYLSPQEIRSLLIQTGDPITDTKVDITKPRVNLGVAATALTSGPPIYVEEGCMLNGWEAPDTSNYWSWDANTWDANVIEEDPEFTNGYYLSH
ncbi:MAG: S8 family serine peptidase, partial [Planctomycetota bacterium]